MAQRPPLRRELGLFLELTEAYCTLDRAISEMHHLGSANAANDPGLRHASLCPAINPAPLLISLPPTRFLLPACIKGPAVAGHETSRFDSKCHKRREQ
jgi:hypothetical protein